MQGFRTPKNVIDFLNGFCFKLDTAGELERQEPASAQVKMKHLFDRHTGTRLCCPGDQVLAVPLVVSPFQAKFMGPHTVLKWL